MTDKRKHPGCKGCKGCKDCEHFDFAAVKRDEGIDFETIFPGYFAGDSEEKRQRRIQMHNLGVGILMVFMISVAAVLTSEAFIWLVRGWLR